VHNKQAKKKRFYHIEKQQQRDKCKEEKNGGWGDTRTTCHKKKTQTHKKRKSVNKKKKNETNCSLHGKSKGENVTCHCLSFNFTLKNFISY
jgi:hypothetical protein